MTGIVEELAAIDEEAMYQEPATTKATIDRAASRIEALEAQLAERDAAKDQAYLERNHLVTALARLYPSGITRTNIPGWSDDWHGCVYIDLPSGQISYHYHDSQAHLFSSLPAYTGSWDGHDKSVVHERLSLVSASQAEAAAAQLRERR